MRRLIAFGLAVMLVAAGLGAVSSPPVRAQDGAILGDAPVLAGGAVVAASGTDIVSAASVPSVDISSRSASANFYFSYYTGQPAIDWTGSQASCTPGTTSAAFKAAVIDRIAFYRAMAGVSSSVGLAADSSALDQQAALMFSRNGALSHTPSTSWACYTSSGAQAAGSSNIALGTYGVSAIDAYMKDAGGNNTAAGHRRWLLFPQTQSFGTGDVPAGNGYASANALWVWDSNVNGPRPGTRDPFVAWPPAGYVPYQVVFPRWTFSYPGANFSAASVTVTLNGASLPVSIDSTSANGYGENTIVFRPNGLGDSSSWPNPGADKTYTVRISNVSGAGQSSFTYNVTIFDPSTTGPGSTPTRTATPSPTRTTGPGTATRTSTTTSGGYAPGDFFMTTTSLSLRSGPGTGYSRIAVLPSGAVGTVTGAPTSSGGFNFYPVTVTGYGSGWAAGEYFAHVTPTVTPTPQRTSTPTRTPTRAPTRTPTTVSQPPTRTPTRIPGGFQIGDTVRTTTTVNFRTGPGTGNNVVAVVSANTRATVTGSPVVNGAYTWYPLTISGVGSGWIASAYLSLAVSGNPSPTATSAGGIGIGATVYTTTSLNIRSGPGTGYSIRGVASKGTTAVVTGSAVKVGTMIWYPLNVTGIGAGWASGTYLSTTPVVQGPQRPTQTPAPAATATAIPPANTPTAQPTLTPLSTETPVAIEEITETATPEVTATVEEPQAAEPQSATETPLPTETAAEADTPGEESPTELPPTEILPTEAPPTEAAPAGLPIARVQRSPDSQPAQVLVDNDPSTVWFANGAGQPLAMFVLDLGQETPFSQVQWLTGDAGLSGTLYLAVSSDGENWTDLDSSLAISTEDGWNALDVAISGRYIRFVFVNDTGAEWLGGISEVHIMP
jgi:uncharacterized protein YraI